jgi:hypothetical protein
MINKTHRIVAIDGQEVRTRCGLRGHKTVVPHEFDTAVCGRFEARVGAADVTCKRCRPTSEAGR